MSSCKVPVIPVICQSNVNFSSRISNNLQISKCLKFRTLGGELFRAATDRQTDRETDGQTDRQRDRQTDRETDRQAEKQTDRQRDRQVDGQTDRRTDRSDEAKSRFSQFFESS